MSGMPRGEIIAMRDSHGRRLAQFGHRVSWRKVRGRTAWTGTCAGCRGELECDRYGTQWLTAPGHPSLLRWPGVSMIARCPAAVVRPGGPR
jgi:hypothetical protein